MLVEDKEVSNDKIVELYLAGYSQKDIASRFNIFPKDIRTILNAEGIETHRFRALDDSVVDIIIQLITNGVQFKDVEEVCDISFHAIREVVSRNNLQRASKRARYNNAILTVPNDFARNDAFIRRYQDGECFCALCKDLNLSDEEILLEFLSIDSDQISQHKKMLEKKVLSDAAQHFSPTAIARKYSISTAVVRAILQK